MNIIEFFDQNWQLQKWQQGFSKRERTLLTGLSGTAKSLVMANAYENVADKYIIVTDSQFHANELYDELSTLLGEEKVFNFFLTITSTQSSHLHLKIELLIDLRHLISYLTKSQQDFWSYLFGITELFTKSRKFFRKLSFTDLWG